MKKLLITLTVVMGCGVVVLIAQAVTPDQSNPMRNAWEKALGRPVTEEDVQPGGVVNEALKNIAADENKKITDDQIKDMVTGTREEAFRANEGIESLTPAEPPQRADFSQQ